MVQIELVPDLSQCIETVARREYWKLVRNYFRTGQGDSQFEEKVELLRNFLESMDFKKLRRESEPHLREGKKVSFIVYWEGGEAKYKLEVEAQA